ncbi:hypothetical protein VNO78_04610 [Psophocarpus tetragonolobus]|uniref:Uncharacterized protein n=1 Tax=Psophocarpus tetragonolobus TaxID=3891 RepID=A0AAN9T241_PSOTE
MSLASIWRDFHGDEEVGDEEAAAEKSKGNNVKSYNNHGDGSQNITGSKTNSGAGAGDRNKYVTNNYYGRPAGPARNKKAARNEAPAIHYGNFMSSKSIGDGNRLLSALREGPHYSYVRRDFMGDDNGSLSLLSAGPSIHDSNFITRKFIGGGARSGSLSSMHETHPAMLVNVPDGEVIRSVDNKNPVDNDEEGSTAFEYSSKSSQ